MDAREGLHCGAAPRLLHARGAVVHRRAAPAMEVSTSTIAMPALSSTMKEGKISQWLMGVGDKVEAGDMVLVVESDKADMDVESYEEGYIAQILVGEGESATVGSPVAVLVENEADIAAVQSGGAPAAAAHGPIPASGRRACRRRRPYSRTSRAPCAPCWCRCHPHPGSACDG